MAYNSNKGNQHMGDVQYEGDPNDVQIDFENDFVAIKTNGQQRFIVSGSAITASVDISGSGAVTIGGNFTADNNNFRVFGNAVRANDFRTPTTRIDSTHISSSLNISGAAFYSNGVELGPAAISVYDDSGNNRVITSVDANAVQGEANLTFDGSRLSVTGDVSGSGTLQAVGATTLGSSLTVSGNVSAGNDTVGTIADFNCAEDANAFRVRAVGAELVRVDANVSNGHSYFRGKARFGSHTVAPTSTVSVTGDISGSGTLQAVGATTLGSNLSVSGNIVVGGPNQANSHLYVKSATDNAFVAFFKSPSHDSIMAITGSGKVAIGGAHVDATLNVSGSDTDKLFSVKSNTVNPAFSVDGDGAVRGRMLHTVVSQFELASGAQSATGRYVALNGAGSVSNTLDKTNALLSPFSGRLISITYYFPGATQNPVNGQPQWLLFVANVNELNGNSIDSAAVATSYCTASSWPGTNYVGGVNVITGDGTLGGTNTTGSWSFGTGSAVGLRFKSGDSTNANIPGSAVVTTVWEFDQLNPFISGSGN